MIWVGVTLASTAIVLAWWSHRDAIASRMKDACVESAHAGYLGALEYVQKRLCRWCKLGVGVSRTRNSGPWRHGAARNEVCQASWVVDYADEYREEARKLGTPK